MGFKRTASTLSRRETRLLKSNWSSEHPLPRSHSASYFMQAVGQLSQSLKVVNVSATMYILLQQTHHDYISTSCGGLDCCFELEREGPHQHIVLRSGSLFLGQSQRGELERSIVNVIPTTDASAAFLGRVSHRAVGHSRH